MMKNKIISIALVCVLQVIGMERTCNSKMVVLPKTKKMEINHSLPYEDKIEQKIICKNLLNDDMLNNLIVVAVREKNVEKCKVLLAMGAPINVRDKEFGNPTLLSIAIENQDKDMVKFLLSVPGVAVNPQQNDIWTPFTDAFWQVICPPIVSSISKVNRTNSTDEKALEIFNRLLIHDDIDINVIGDDGMSVLHLAVQYNCVEGVKVFLAHRDINVNIQDALSWTPLYRAVVNSNKEIVKLLLAHTDIDTSIKDRKGKAARDIAVEKGYADIVALFDEYEANKKA